MKMHQLPERNEWGFSDVPSGEMWAALVYEYHREAIRSPVGRFREVIKNVQRFMRSMKNDALIEESPRVIPELYFRLIKNRARHGLASPWLSLRANIRSQIAGAFPAPATVPSLETSTEWLWVLAGAVDADAEKLAEQMLAIRTVPFFLPPGVSRRGLVARFDQWLKQNPEWTASARSGREKRKWQPRELLRYLAVRRLAKACGGERELVEEAETNEDVGRELRRPRCAIPEEPEIARMVRKANAVIDSVVDGRLHEFRMPSAAVIPAPQAR